MLNYFIPHYVAETVSDRVLCNPTKIILFFVNES